MIAFSSFQSSRRGETRFSLGGFRKGFKRKENERLSLRSRWLLACREDQSKTQRTLRTTLMRPRSARGRLRTPWMKDTHTVPGSADGIYNSYVHVAYICKATGVLPSEHRGTRAPFSFSNSSPGDFKQSPLRDVLYFRPHSKLLPSRLESLSAKSSCARSSVVPFSQLAFFLFFPETFHAVLTTLEANDARGILRMVAEC